MGLVRMAARTAVVVGTANAVSNRQADKHAAKEQEAAGQQAPAAPAQDDSMAKLQQLADLHASGVLSDDEFTAAKAKVLGI